MSVMCGFTAFFVWNTVCYTLKTDKSTAKHLKLSSQFEESLSLQENKLAFSTVPILLCYSRDVCAWVVPEINGCIITACHIVAVLIRSPATAITSSPCLSWVQTAGLLRPPTGLQPFRWSPIVDLSHKRQVNIGLKIKGGTFHPGFLQVTWFL